MRASHHVYFGELKAGDRFLLNGREHEKTLSIATGITRHHPKGKGIINNFQVSDGTVSGMGDGVEVHAPHLL
jgi:hypothetical protein